MADIIITNGIVVTMDPQRRVIENGAVAIAMHQVENVDIAEFDATLQKYADAVRSRVRGSQPQALLAHLHDVLFEEEKFTGNQEDYYNTANSYLPEVLRTKRGLPITLSLIYKVVAERLGLPEEKTVINIGDYGNTTGGTIPLATHDALEQGRLKKGDLVLMAAVGAGLTAGGALWRWAY